MKPIAPHFYHHWAILAAIILLFITSAPSFAWTQADVQALPQGYVEPIKEGMTWDYTIEDDRYLTLLYLRVHKLYRGVTTNGSSTVGYLTINVNSEAMTSDLPDSVCLPASSDSLLVAVQKHVTSNYLPLIRNVILRKNGFPAQSRFVLSIGTCGKGNDIIIGAYVADINTKFNCALRAPDTVAFRPGDPVRRTENFFVSCTGDGQADVRLRVEGLTAITPGQGVSVSTQPPTQYTRVNAGESKVIPVTFDLKTNAAKPGQYSGTFVYALEYL